MNWMIRTVLAPLAVIVVTCVSAHAIDAVKSVNPESVTTTIIGSERSVRHNVDPGRFEVRNGLKRQQQAEPIQLVSAEEDNGGFIVLVAETFAAAAGQSDTTGSIKSIDLKARTITLANNKVYSLPANVDPAKLKVGQRVKVVFQQQGSKNIATAIVHPCD